MQFIKGMDVSMIKELENHGASYYLKGNKEDIFSILKECSVNMIRLRLWRDPYSSDGESYGGGTNDLETTLELARRAKENGMQVLLDIHYSDFWADPAKQVKPKAWSKISGAELEGTVYGYTALVLKEFKKNDLIPEMIQIGNEITKGLLWPDGHIDRVSNMARLLKAGIKAARHVCPESKIVLHLDFGTNNELYRDWFKALEPYNIDYDVIGMSYYPHWNGSIKELVDNMNDISKRYDKDVIVAETSIGYTLDDLGCKGIVYGENEEKATGYPASQEGQAKFLKDLYEAVRGVSDNHGIGVFYWEPEWLPIPDCTWGSPKGCDYMHDPVEAGNAMANQALFDKNGNANEALLALAGM
ncbi:glycoside hydrolase family 53 protein [Butyrivibrio sp. WCE2006]|uniref:glycoside hydrolase family 53 protein n=1 Tax=Butyrivibrio sp. WCE2006 TaxID=1410611 RepID=UPI0005D18526|nr:glycosyl hydrolase 53 family protein [Butyrivibrio sp. WCE2006]